MTRTPLPAVVSFATLIVSTSVVVGQDKLTAHTMKLQDGASSPPASIADVAWIAGHWAGEAFGGECEEIWSRPKGGSMLGMFRLIKDGQPVFFELLSLSEVKDTVLLRLKHFHPDLRGWEAKDETVDFPLVAFTENELFFEGMTFRRSSLNEINIYLAIRPEDGPVREVSFTYERVERR